MSEVLNKIGLLSKETQDVINKALSHWPFAED